MKISYSIVCSFLFMLCLSFSTEISAQDAAEKSVPQTKAEIKKAKFEAAKAKKLEQLRKVKEGKVKPEKKVRELPESASAKAKQKASEAGNPGTSRERPYKDGKFVDEVKPTKSAAELKADNANKKMAIKETVSKGQAKIDAGRAKIDAAKKKLEASQKSGTLTEKEIKDWQIKIMRAEGMLRAYEHSIQKGSEAIKN